VVFESIHCCVQFKTSPLCMVNKMYHIHFGSSSYRSGCAARNILHESIHSSKN
jgi:hypothetical protein